MKIFERKEWKTNWEEINTPLKLSLCTFLIYECVILRSKSKWKKNVYYKMIKWCTSKDTNDFLIVYDDKIYMRKCY